MTEPRVICTELPGDVLEALERFRSEQAGNMKPSEALALLVRDALIGAGYLDAPAEEE